MSTQEVTEEQSGKLVPRSRRGMRTRGALVTAAREVFERDGYLDARISDISKAAGVASGSFYTYFDSKEEVFAEVVEQLREEMLHPHIRQRSGVDDPRLLIEAANREYLLSYQRNHRLMAVLEQVAQVDEQFRTIRFDRAKAFGERNAALIRSLQAAGSIEADLDPWVTALSLSTMTSRMAYMVFVQGEDIAFERLLSGLNRIWFNTLGLSPSH
ncbi:TetR/AcrR family transcriptional regulator [Nocardia sp. BMG111209]|uniref:TetR/AcrR family transcriptional regulator n=1 Tax=Nocardia sp. BMG111209 TaxID=1160137 RepID=UPI001E4B5159|nr:TetR/AcrR family transcriptional regulator [Nocardia sp. BMG111209]